ncbi:uncharacterized protein [Parasteatoda tepidariorum]|uniref:uncharacterized protein isoform X1 n=1 Tax=Parasteatoda tepidariorum TaxID=114398 RepID=UPI001C725750|nr:uncharacterized protein LOC107445666 isoform X3 [Parasteatoda tepidariorum]
MDYDLFKNEITSKEIIWLLLALDNKILFYSGQNEELMKRLCCHSHEKFFLNKNDSKLLNRRVIPEKNFGFLSELFRRMNLLTNFEPSVRPLASKLLELTENKHYTEMLLFCASLLIDFHFDHSCSKYMSLALKFYLKAYQFSEFGYYEECSTIATDLLSYLRYISASPYHYQRELFTGYIEEFLKFCDLHCSPFRLGKDVLCPILDEAFDLSHKYNFGFLPFGDIGSSYYKKKYNQRSLIENCEQYMILTRNGFEDRYFGEAVKEYKYALIRTDINNVFGFQDIVVQEFNTVMYRSVQVLFLYIECIYYGGYGGSKIGMETLQRVWATTPDPFLSKSQFLSCFKELQADVQPELHRAWDWYQKNVLTDGDSGESSPRSLKHISRCAIRRRLTECSHVPNCVKSFEIPVTLKNYLRLI